MKTLLICHQGARLNQEGLLSWLASFSDVVGVVEIEEKGERGRQRVRREIERVGWFRFLDVMAFRLHYRAFQASRDAAWTDAETERLVRTYPADLASIPRHRTHSPNAKDTVAFIQDKQPDIVIARCKSLLRKRVYSIPSRGVLVMHPGVCPEYRNAHGCFWAMAQDDPERVGMTLLKIDAGIDTGPVYGYYSYDFNPLRESHIVIQHRVVTENLDALKAKLQEIDAGTAVPIDTTGRESAVWGQPWLTRHFAIRRRFRRRRG